MTVTSRVIGCSQDRNKESDLGERTHSTQSKSPASRTRDRRTNTEPSMLASDPNSSSATPASNTEQNQAHRGLHQNVVHEYKRRPQRVSRKHHDVTEQESDTLMPHPRYISPESPTQVCAWKRPQSLNRLRCVTLPPTPAGKGTPRGVDPVSGRKRGNARQERSSELGISA